MQSSWEIKYKHAGLHCASPGMFYFCRNRAVIKSSQLEYLLMYGWTAHVAAVHVHPSNFFIDTVAPFAVWPPGTLGVCTSIL